MTTNSMKDAKLFYARIFVSYCLVTVNPLKKKKKKKKRKWVLDAEFGLDDEEKRAGRTGDWGNAVALKAKAVVG